MRGLILAATVLVAGGAYAVDITLGETFTPAYQTLVENAVQDQGTIANHTKINNKYISIYGTNEINLTGADITVNGVLGFTGIGTSIDLSESIPLIGPLNPTNGIMVGDRDYNDLRYPRSIYGELNVHDSSAITNDIPNGTTYIRLPWTNIGFTNGVTASTATSNMTLTVNGRYQVTGTFCFSGEGNGVSWKGAVFQDNVEQDHIHFMRKIGTGGDQGSAPFSGFLSVTNQPAVIDFRVRHDYQIGAREIYVTYANFGVVYIGKE